MGTWMTNLLFGQVVGQVGDHNLGLGRDAISGGSTLTALAGGASLVLGLFSLVSPDLVCNIAQWLNLRVGLLGSGLGASGSISFGSLSFVLLLVVASILIMTIHVSQGQTVAWF